MKRAIYCTLLFVFGCGVRTERMVPDVRPADVPFGAHVVRAVEVSSDYAAAALRVVSPSELAEVLRQGLTRAGVYGPTGRYVVRATIVKLMGGSSGGFKRYASIVVDSRLVDDREPAWDWHERLLGSAGLFQFPGLEQYSGVDAQREAFEAAVRDVAGEIVEHVRDSLVRRSAIPLDAHG